MLIGRVKGTVTSTAKAEALTGLKLLIVDVVGAKGQVLTSSCVAADTVGAGAGDSVLLTQGSAARMSAGLSGAPIDLAIVGILDHINT